MEVGALWVKLGLNDQEYKDGLDDAKGKGQGLSGFLKNSFSFAVGQGMFDLLKTSIKGAWDASIGFNSTMQQNEIAFKSMLGSGEAASDLLGKLTKMAAATPFEFPELADASKKMLAFGFSAESIPGMITKIGDAASGLGMGGDGVQRLILAMGQMKAKAKVSAGEMMQLTEAGVPAWDILAKAMGKSTAEVMALSEKGLIPADKAIQQLTDGMESRFPNMMSKQSASFAGLMSTIKDTTNQVFGQVFKPTFEWLTGSALPGVVAGLGSFQDALGKGQPIFLAIRTAIKETFGSEIAANILSVTDKITGLGIAIYGLITGDESAIWDSFADWLGISPGLADILTTSLLAVRDAITGVFTWIMQNGSTVTGVFVAIGAAMAAYKLAVMASIVSQEIHNGLLLISAFRSGGLAAAQTALAGAQGAATLAQKALNLAMEMNPLGIIIALVGALVAAFVYLWNTNEGFRTALIAAWDTIKTAASDLFTSVIGFFTGIYTGIATAVAAIFQSISDTWTNITNTTTTIFSAIGEFFSKWWTTLLLVFLGPLGYLIVYCVQHWTEINTKANEIFTTLQLFFTTIFTAISNFINGIWSGIYSKAAEIWGGIYTFVTGKLNDLKTTASSIANGIKNAIVSAWEGITGEASRIFNNVKDTIVNIFKGIHIPMPHFNFGSSMKEIAGVQFPVPSVDVDWYAKGGIFSGPSVIGVGEAGDEAVLPISKLSGLLADALNSLGVGAGGAAMAGAGGGNTYIDLHIDADQLRKIADVIALLESLRQTKRSR